jgi:hypothetical protein
MLYQSGEQFMQCIVTGDETWINHVTPKTEKVSKTGNTHHLPQKINLKQRCQIMETLFGP